MSKIASLFGLLEQLESPKIAVKPNRCVSVRNRNVACLKCQAACTTGCISRSDDGSVVISSEKCIGCGACATACPTGAIVMRDPDDSHLLRETSSKMAAAEGRCAVVCEQLLAKAGGLCDPEKVTSVPCLARFDEGMLCALVAMGAYSVTLVHGECSSCSHSQGSRTCAMVVKGANELLNVWGSHVSIKLTNRLPGFTKAVDEGYDKGKRAFLKGACRDSMSVVDSAASVAAVSAMGAGPSQSSKAPSYVKVGADGTLPQSLPNRRKRLNAALKSLGEPQDLMIETRLWGHVVIDEDRCQGCRMCALFCPTGALRKFSEEDGTCGMTHAPSLCVRCGMCEQVCPISCVEISLEVFARDMLKDEVDRYVTRGLEVRPSDPHQIHRKMKKALGFERVFER